MSSTIKGLVSKNKIRYKEDGFDLDLTYICDNLIAMGFPGENIEALYRNNIEDVKKFLEKKHRGRYRIYNLCCDDERSYDHEKFRGQVVHFPFKDHNPPSLSIIPEFCKDMQAWLSEDKDNVAAVHCKAGKGRTGTMICCYLLHTGQLETALDALNFYAEKRTKDTKGVTIPSQQRYVLYYEHLLKNPDIKYTIKPIILREFRFEGNLNTNTSSAWINISVGDNSFCSGNMAVEWKKGTPLKILLEAPLVLRGDVKVDIKVKSLVGRKEKLCHFWFNTFFIDKDDSAVRDDMEATDWSKTYVKFALRDHTTVHSSSDNIQQPSLDRTRSYPGPPDTHRSRIPDSWIAESEVFSRCSTANSTLFLSFSKSQLDISNKKLFTNDSDFIITLGFSPEDSVASPRCYRSNSDSTAPQSQQSPQYRYSSSSSNSSTDEDISSDGSGESGGANVGRASDVTTTTASKHYMV